jgi:Zn-finger nucleic acid-binding protein
MNCPKCDTELVKKYYKGMMEVDSCPQCRGMWLDFDELDRLEDVTFDDDAHKGSLVHREADTSFPCPVCGDKMQEFQYRLYSLKLETCAVKGHGFWLDAAEDERVMEIMRQRAGEVTRKRAAESQWAGLLKKMHKLINQ